MKRNKNKIIVFVIILILLIGFVIFDFNKKSSYIGGPSDFSALNIGYYIDLDLGDINSQQNIERLLQTLNIVQSIDNLDDKYLEIQIQTDYLTIEPEVFETPIIEANLDTVNESCSCPNDYVEEEVFLCFGPPSKNLPGGVDRDDDVEEEVKDVVEKMKKFAKNQSDVEGVSAQGEVAAIVVVLDDGSVITTYQDLAVGGGTLNTNAIDQALLDHKNDIDTIYIFHTHDEKSVTESGLGCTDENGETTIQNAPVPSYPDSIGSIILQDAYPDINIETYVVTEDFGIWEFDVSTKKDFAEITRALFAYAIDNPDEFTGLSSCTDNFEELIGSLDCGDAKLYIKFIELELERANPENENREDVIKEYIKVARKLGINIFKTNKFD